MDVEKTQTLGGSPRSRLISEFNYLKIFALFLLLFVHSDLILTHPEVIYPVEWFLLSAFFFISGFLVYDSFLKRDHSLRRFFWSKFKTLYLPFMGAVLFYFTWQIILGMDANAFALVPQLSMASIFDEVNVSYNYGSLWFIPYLLVFMLIICLLEKYVKSTRAQVAVVSAVWLCNIFLWVFNSPLRLGALFTQFLLVFVFGFYVNKFHLYDRMMTYKMAVVAVPLVAFFSFDFLNYFTFDVTWLEDFEANLYFNARSIILTLGLVLLVLLFLRKVKVPKNGFAKKIASKSAFIYLSEPFISFLILAYGFGLPDAFLADGPVFYLYQAVRTVALLVGVPLAFMAWKKISQRREAAQEAPVSK